MIIIESIKDKNVSNLKVLDEYDNIFKIEYIENGEKKVEWIEKHKLNFVDDIYVQALHAERTKEINEVLNTYTSNSFIEKFQSDFPEEYKKKLNEWSQFTKENDYVIYSNGRKVPAKQYADINVNRMSIASNEDFTFSEGNYCQISQYAGCSDLCLPYQAKIMYKNKSEFKSDLKKLKQMQMDGQDVDDIIKIFDEMIDYNVATSGSDVGWLFHHGCKHSSFPFDPFYNKPPKPKFTDEQILKYREQQLQTSKKKAGKII